MYSCVLMYYIDINYSGFYSKMRPKKFRKEISLYNDFIFLNLVCEKLKNQKFINFKCMSKILNKQIGKTNVQNCYASYIINSDSVFFIFKSVFGIYYYYTTTFCYGILDHY